MKPEKKPFPTCPVLDVPVAVTRMRDVVRRLTRDIDRYRGQYICISNVHTTVTAHDDQGYMDVQRDALFVAPDGKPLVFVCRQRGYAEAERVAGPDLMPAILEVAEEMGYSSYFYGSSKRTLRLLRRNLKRRYPNLIIAGMCSPPYRRLTAEEDRRIVKKINAAKPDFVWVGLGAPKQERWMADHKNRINAVMIGVGAAFDFEAGTRKRAPKWVQELYLEWLFRLIQDPKRLFKRYMTTNIRFVTLNLSEAYEYIKSLISGRNGDGG